MNPDSDSMYVSEVENVMHGSASWKSAEKGRKNSIWHLHFTEMGKKTVIRRLMKYLPKSSEVLQTALAGDEQVFDRYDCGLGVSGLRRWSVLWMVSRWWWVIIRGRCCNCCH